VGNNTTLQLHPSEMQQTF